MQFKGKHRQINVDKEFQVNQPLTNINVKQDFALVFSRLFKQIVDLLHS